MSSIIVSQHQLQSHLSLSSLNLKLKHHLGRPLNPLRRPKLELPNLKRFGRLPLSTHFPRKAKFIFLVHISRDRNLEPRDVLQAGERGLRGKRRDGERKGRGGVALRVREGELVRRDGGLQGFFGWAELFPSVNLLGLSVFLPVTYRQEADLVPRKPLHSSRRERNGIAHSAAHQILLK